MNEGSRDLEDRLLRALAAAPAGLSSSELKRQARLGSASPSTLNRALSSLRERGLVRAQGQTRARRYFAAEVADADSVREAEQAQPPLSLSAGAKGLSERSRRSLSQRPHATFERAFLDEYRPGETYYLPAELRARLATIGRTGDAAAPGGTYARQILQRLLIDLSWNSSRLAGNTYSLLDTERLIGEPEALDGKDLAERQMILNHKDAIEWLVEDAAEAAPSRLDVWMIRSLHGLLTENLLGNAGDEGRLRAAPALIQGSTFVPLAVPQQIEECLSQIMLTAEAIEDPFERSFFLLVQIPYLQPFINGNKRTARLAANIPMIRENLRPLTFMDLPRRELIEGHLAVYELREVGLLRELFVWAYERSCASYGAIQRSLGEPDPFRLAHRELIRETVAALVRAGISAAQLREPVAPFAARLSAGERPRFIAVIEAELRGLHEGNFARLRLRPAEFEMWRARPA